MKDFSDFRKNLITYSDKALQDISTAVSKASSNNKVDTHKLIATLYSEQIKNTVNLLELYHEWLNQ